MSKITTEINEHFKNIIQKRKEGVIAPDKKRKDFYYARYEYLLIQTQQILNKDLEIIEKAYQKGLTNENDGVFLAVNMRNNYFTFSKEVATHIKKEFNVDSMKLNEEQIIELLKKEIRKEKPNNSIFIRNEQALHLFEGKRKKEVINDFFKKNTSISDEDLKNYDNLFNITTNDYLGNNFMEMALSVGQEEFKKKMKAVIRNTEDMGCVLEETLMELGFKAKESGNYPRLYTITGGNEIILYLETGLFFNHSESENINVFLEVLNNTKNVLKNLNKESDSILNLFYFYQRGNSKISNYGLLNFENNTRDIVSKIFDNIENWTISELEMLEMSLLYIYNDHKSRVNIKTELIERFNNLSDDAIIQLKDGKINERKSYFNVLKQRRLNKINNRSISTEVPMIGHKFAVKDLIELIGAVDENKLVLFYRKVLDKLGIVSQNTEANEMILLPAEIPFNDFVEYLTLSYAKVYEEENKNDFEVSKESFREFNLKKSLPNKDISKSTKRKI